MANDERQLPPGAVAAERLLDDDFTRDARPGRVIGSRTGSGQLRRGIDRDRALSIDHHALRIRPLIEPGWNRAVLAYGPFTRRAGLALAVFMLNGHNTAQVEGLGESLASRLHRWWLGSGTWGRRDRVLRWLRAGRYLRTLHRLRCWLATTRLGDALPVLDENLAVGWFGGMAVDNPVGRGNAFVMHATGPRNGALWSHVSGLPLTVVEDVQNLPLCYVVVLREQGAVYYAASSPASAALPTPPALRPLAIDTRATEPEVYALVSQSHIGQIGFRLDSRIYGVRVAALEGFASWHGGAMAADCLCGSGPLDAAGEGPPGGWKTHTGHFLRTADGLEATAAPARATAQTETPWGLIHLQLRVPRQGHSGLLLDWQDARNHVAVELSAGRCRLVCCRDGTSTALAEAAADCLDPDAGFQPVQVRRRGNTLHVVIGGQALLDSRPETLAAPRWLTVGLFASDTAGDARVRDFEVHGETLQLPEWLDFNHHGIAPGDTPVVREHFGGPPRDLADQPAGEGGHRWQRLMGRGHIDITGQNAARVRATATAPNPDRTAYVIDWDGGLADLEAEITVPGSARGQDENSRTGFIFWQDDDNYLIVNLWRSDSYEGASISTFFQIDGFEDLYDAIWTNVGARVGYGERVRLRMACDGAQYLVWLDDEPVLYRRLSDVYPHRERIRLNKVGLVANWEWGDDTGSIIHRFTARTRRD